MERNFYTALRQLMETVEDDNYELEWRSHKVTRLGSFAEADWGFVLCFGRIKHGFKSQQYLTELLQYLQTHKAYFEVQSKKLSNWMPVDNFRDLVDIVADSYLDSYFSDLASSGLDIAITEYDVTAVEVLETRINKLLNQIVTVEHSINSDLYFWGKPVLSSAEKSYYKETLSASKEFLESLSNYTSPVKFKNQLSSILNELSPIVTYLSVAGTNLPEQHEWIIEMQQLRQHLCNQISDVSKRNATGFSYHSQQQLKALKNKYIKTYINNGPKFYYKK